MKRLKLLPATIVLSESDDLGNYLKETSSHFTGLAADSAKVYLIGSDESNLQRVVGAVQMAVGEFMKFPEVLSAIGWPRFERNYYPDVILAAAWHQDKVLAESEKKPIIEERTNPLGVLNMFAQTPTDYGLIGDFVSRDFDAMQKVA